MKKVISFERINNMSNDERQQMIEGYRYFTAHHDCLYMHEDLSTVYEEKVHTIEGEERRFVTHNVEEIKEKAQILAQELHSLGKVTLSEENPSILNISVGGSNKQYLWYVRDDAIHIYSKFGRKVLSRFLSSIE